MNRLARLWAELRCILGIHEIYTYRFAGGYSQCRCSRCGLTWTER